ncbi:universal stress protein A family protein C25B2.10-like isoform X2 [Bidens hawaiensis]|uniref:universal stress protein A family protein C25B2.10-like isoform X2 n=1 Tax=Bidens hawaiensis TaxID=980011 RepID=UPI0040494FD3
MSFRMQTLNEEEEYNWTQKDSVARSRRTGRDIVIAVDHGPKSKHAFDWALHNFCCAGDTVYLVHSVSSLKNKIVYDVSQTLMDKLSAQALKVSSVKIVTRIVEGDAGKAICKEAERVKPIALVMGTRGRSLMQSVLQGSVSEYCFHNFKAAPVIIVPGIEGGEESVSSLDTK